MKQLYNTLIVDDEELARNDLKAILSEFENIKVKGEAESIMVAIDLINKNSFDIIFLDIQLGRNSGFELLNLVKKNTRVIFVTAYDDYAIKAFEVNAQDYLLKPVSAERMKIALENIEDGNENGGEKPLSYADSIFIKNDNKYAFLPIKNIIAIKAADDYSEIITVNPKKRLVLKTLKEWEIRLPEKMFCRIHRSTIININKVDKIEPWFNSSQRVYMQGIEEPFVMSKRHFTKIRELLG